MTIPLHRSPSSTASQGPGDVRRHRVRGRSPATGYTWGSALADGPGPGPNAPPWSRAVTRSGRRRPWSSPMFWPRRAPPSPPRPSPMCCGPRRRRVSREGGRSSTTPAGRSSHLRGWFESDGHRSPPDGDWDSALIMADSMARATRVGDGGTTLLQGGHWSERAVSLLAPLLHAAALEGESMATLLHWVDRHDGSHAARGTGRPRPSSPTLRPTCSPASWRRISGSSQASGPPRRASSAPIAPARRWPPPSPPSSTPGCSATEPTRCTSAPPGRQQQLFAPLMVGVLERHPGRRLPPGPTGRRRTAGAAGPGRGGQHRTHP